MSDVVLADIAGVNVTGLVALRSGASEGLNGVDGGPPFENVNPPGIDQVRAHREVEAALGHPCLPDDLDAARKVGVSMVRVDHQVSSNDDHGLLRSSARTAVLVDDRVTVNEQARGVLVHTGEPERLAVCQAADEVVAAAEQDGVH